MASRRNLKKDINFLTSEMLMQCDVTLYLTPDVSKSKVIEIAEALIDAKEDAISKICKPVFVQGGSRPGNKYCKSIVVDFVAKSNELLDKLAKLK